MLLFTAPSGAKVANQVIDNNNGSYTVRYVVSEVGKYFCLRYKYTTRSSSYTTGRAA